MTSTPSFSTGHGSVAVAPAPRGSSCRQEGPLLVLETPRRVWRLHHPRNLEELWDAMDELDEWALADERIPYWVELWPSSLALADLLVDRRAELACGACLDLGCGCGFTALTVSECGVPVLACDYFPEALACVRRNALLNDVPSPQLLCMDWRQPPLAPGSVWRLWAADILYERRSFEPVLRCIAHVLAPGALAWIAEPGRSIFGEFLALAQESHWRIRPILRRNTVDLYAAHVPVTIWELRPPEVV